MGEKKKRKIPLHGFVNTVILDDFSKKKSGEEYELGNHKNLSFNINFTIYYLFNNLLNLMTSEITHDKYLISINVRVLTC